MAGATGLGLGCVVLVEDSCDDVECGGNAYCDRGICECVGGYDGDPDDFCDPIQTVLITDDCPDGKDVEFVFWSQDRDWKWPAGPDVYVTVGYGANTGVELLCYEGEVLCFGGQAGELTWGVGLDGTEECVGDWCCFECYPDVYDLGLLECG